MGSVFFALGGLFGFLSVALGAFGAHALKTRITSDMLSVYHTGVEYQMYHALALLAVGLVLRIGVGNPVAGTGWFTASGWCFTIGIVLFSGSLYGLSLTNVTAFGPITPLGGLAFLAGWVCLLVGGLLRF